MNPFETTDSLNFGPADDRSTPDDEDATRARMMMDTIEKAQAKDRAEASAVDQVYVLGRGIAALRFALGAEHPVVQQLITEEYEPRLVTLTEEEAEDFAARTSLVFLQLFVRALGF